MARGKKKEELTLEEKLEQALVPVEEQPYEVSGNWCWVRLGHVCEIAMGQSPSGTDVTDDENYTPLIGGASDMGELYPTASRYTKVSTKLSKKDDIIVCIRATLGNPIYSDGEYCLGRGVAGIRAICCGKEYLRYFFKTFEQYLYDNATGTTFAQVTGKVLAKMPFPLPPLDEQQRIVEQIENLFAKLDEAKDKVQEAIAQYGLRITSILHKALTGDLSLEWRTMHETTKENWEIKKIKDVCKPRAGYAFDSKKFQNHGCQIIRMGNLYGGVLDLSRSPVFICEDEIDEKMIDRAKIKHGDILITLTGTKYKRDYGYAVCIENPENLYVNQRILCLTPNENINRDYLLYYLQSNIFRDIFFSNETGGVNQGNVSSKFVENIEIRIPPIEEQRVIVRELNNMLLKEAQAAELAGCVLQRIDLMKKSILAKAFRGELRTNNPEEESAIELLKTILAET